MQNAIYFVVKMPVLQENHEKFQELAAELIEKSRQEEGNIAYCLAANKKEPDALFFLECWKSREAIAFHNETDHFKETLPKLVALCTAPPTKETYIEL
jgi:quinol monooxygenase YgiN